MSLRFDKSSYYNSVPSTSAMGREFEDCYDSDNNSIAKRNLKKNIEHVKNSSENRKNKNGMKSEFGFNSLSLNSTKNTTKKNFNAEIALNENHVIPEVEVLRIAKILKVYSYGVNIENFKFIYNILYHNILSPEDYGFISIKELLKELNTIVKIQNNILYPNYEFKFYDQMDLKNYNINKQGCLKSSTIWFKNRFHVGLNIEHPSFSLNEVKPQKKMMLREIYNPSLFYLQLWFKKNQFLDLMKQMQRFYETENTYYLVEPPQIFPGSCYASSYTSFSSPKQWYRIKVLREVNSAFVDIIHVDYGTVDNIPKTELRFLKLEFCDLPYQAIHCCLSGYNKLDTIAPEVTKAFVELLDMNKMVYMMVDEHFVLNEQCQILHVTLFQHTSISNKIVNINNELTLFHLKL